MKYRLSFLIFAFFLLCASACGKQEFADLSSPNSSLRLSVWLDSFGSPYYSLYKDSNIIIEKSALALKSDSLNIHKGFSLKEIISDSKDEVWEQVWGENKKNINKYKEQLYIFENDDNVRLSIRFRLFDDGLGFRYEYEAKNVDSIYINDELSEFNFTEDLNTLSIPANFDTYELEYRNMKLSALDNANTPITLWNDNGIYLSLHEAALYDFPEMTLQKKDDFSLKSNLAPLPDGTKAKKANKFISPWRSIQIGSKAIDLINSSLILNLNEPSKIKDTSWIKPTKYIGIWWGMHLGIETWHSGDRHGATTANAKKYIDFAVRNNIPAVLFEGWNAGWETWGDSQSFDFTKPAVDFDMDEIVSYAKSKGIEIIGHHETGANVVPYEEQLDKTLSWNKERNIRYIKTGYAGGYKDSHSHHNQYAVNHYQRVVEKAAEYHTMIDAHEIIKDTGIRRTWPNMMTRECARGMEWNAWSEGNSPHHHIDLMFTRLLSGPMDYTPGIFDIMLDNTRNSPKRQKWNSLDKGNSRVNTTLARQVAAWVLMYSPMQMASDLIEHYEGHPAFQFFRDYEADIDESKALKGEIAKYIVIMRRSKNKYFIAAATNEEPREIELTLNFLPKNKKYKARIYSDGDKADWKTNPLDYKIEERLLSSDDTISIKMASGGGQAISLEEI